MVLLSYSPCCVSNRLQPAEIAFNLRKSVKNQMASSSLHSQSFAEIFVDFTNGPPPKKKKKKHIIKSQELQYGIPCPESGLKKYDDKKKGLSCTEIQNPWIFYVIFIFTCLFCSRPATVCQLSHLTWSHERREKTAWSGPPHRCGHMGPKKSKVTCDNQPQFGCFRK